MWRRPKYIFIRHNRKTRLWIVVSIVIIIAGIFLLVAVSKSFGQERAAQEGDSAAAMDRPIETPDEPLYSPFTARFLMDEVKQLRIDVERTRADLIERQVQREYGIAKDAAGYARYAVELFFFIITGVTTLLVFLGWSSIRDIRSRVAEIAETQVESLVAGYSERLDAIEAELHEKSDRLREAQNEIEQTNEIHSLWLRARQQTTPAAKIAIYDDILKMRPDDTEAMTFKADAALQLDEAQWAMSLANRALDIDPKNAHAFYQRACAHAFSGAPEEAITDLHAAIAISESYRSEAEHDPAFDTIKDTDAFRETIQREEVAR